MPAPPNTTQVWPNPVLRPSRHAWRDGYTKGLCIPRDADYFYPYVWISVNGVQRATSRAPGVGSVAVQTLSITDILDETPSTARFTCRGFTPTVGMDVIVTLGSQTKQNPDRLFGGIVLNVTPRYDGQPANAAFDVSCIDYTWLLQKAKVNLQASNQRFHVTLLALLETYAPGFTANHVVSLDSLDLISFTNQDLPSAITQGMKRVGGYWYADYYKDIHAFIEESGETPRPLTASHPSLANVSSHTDLGQVITRELSEGGGVNAFSDVAVGETILPIEPQGDAWYETGGGTVVCGANRPTYTSKVAAGTGSLVGTGASPSSAPNLTAASGAGIESGAHTYAYTDVTAAGESLPSPLASVTLGPIAAPSSAPSLVQFPDGSSDWFFGNGPTSPQNIEWAVTFYNGAGETTASPVSNNITFDATTAAPGTIRSFSIHNLPIGPSGTTGRKLYRASSHLGTLKFVKTIADNTTTDVTDDVLDASLGATAPTSNTASVNQASLTSISTGAASVTARKVYRTVAAGSQLKLLATLADNTTTTYTDSTADASLGANVPTSDTSGLAQPSGQVLAGSTSLIAASISWASSTGGWAVIGNGQQVIRYTGYSGNSLTGIPASGAGAITATISYNSTITAAACLKGIPASGTGSIRYAIKRGDPVNLLVQVDDADAQATLAALLTTATYTHDGIIEDYISDGRIGHAEALARASAQLALRSTVETKIAYTCREVTKSGQTVHVDLPAPQSLTGDFMIQQVDIDSFSANGEFYPTFRVRASTTRFSLEDLLRRALAVAA